MRAGGPQDAGGTHGTDLPDPVPEPVIVSACLVGENCRFDGSPLPAETRDRVAAFLHGKSFVAVCPEELGGLATPRPPVEIESGDGGDVVRGAARVIDSEGRDRTAELIRGGREALRIAREAGARLAILKERSPSCGTKMISRKGVKTRGIGVTCALLRRVHIDVISEEDIPRR